VTAPTLLSRVRVARQGMGVERLHVHPHALRYSVGQHTADLAALVTLCWMHDHGGAAPSAALLLAAVFHDVPEAYTGDCPGPLKRHLGSVMDVMEARVTRHLGVATMLTTEERAYLEYCDKTELWLWAWEEGLRGNSWFAGSWLSAEYFTRCGELPMPPAVRALRKAVVLEGGVFPLDIMEMEKLLDGC
jgi:hypothetical protein